MPTDSTRFRDHPDVHLTEAVGRGFRRIAATILLLVASAAPSACRRHVPAAAEAAPDAAASSVAPTPAASLPTPPAGVDVPAGYLHAHVFRVVETSQGDVVLLAEPGETRFLPIFIGGTEALSIRMRVERQRYPRPLTHDLLDTVVDKLGGHIVEVQVDDIKNKVFIGRVFVSQGDRTFDVDARPSDTIALASGNGVPILAAGAVFDAAAIPASELGLGKEPDGLRGPSRSKPDEPTQL